MEFVLGVFSVGVPSRNTVAVQNTCTCLTSHAVVKLAACLRERSICGYIVTYLHTADLTLSVADDH